MAYPFADGQAIALHRDVDATVASLASVAPLAGRGWREVVEPLLARRDRVLRAALTPAFPPVRDGIALALGLRRESLELARLLLASCATFSREVLRDERAAAWFSSSAMHADLTPGTAGGAAFAFALKLLGHTVGWGYPRGGAGKLAETLASRVRELGGDVRCAAHVDAVALRHGRVAGVRLHGGDTVPAEAVVVALSAARAVHLLPADGLPGRLMRRLRDWRYGLGTFKVDYALSGPAPWTSADTRRAGVVHVGGPLAALFHAHQQAGAGQVPQDPSLVVGQHSLHDDSRASAGRHTLYVYTHVPQRLDVPPDEVVERVERRLEQFAPGFGRGRA
jgi:phytoene dehydrogenase-like protein